MRRGTIVASAPIDDALAVFFPAPRTYTGEDMLELHCHGSPIVVERVIQAAIAAGARAADGGEFSRRAVLNGRMDLLQAEAVADLIEARMSAGAHAAWEQLQGALSQRLLGLRSRLVAVLADVEAHVDFSDDELPDESWPARRRALTHVCEEIEQMLDGFAAARRQREGLRVVVTGRPNAGKSSIINRLLGSERMIVTDEPGTTRDVVEESLDFDGLAFVLADTAGLRVSDSAAETLAVARARQVLARADIVVYVIDASVALTAEDIEQVGSLAAGKLVIVMNKQDLGGPLQDLPFAVDVVVATSARTGSGCQDLAAELRRLGASLVETQPAGISRLRHRAALERAFRHLRDASDAMASEAGTEIAVIELRAALHQIGTLTDVLDNEEILDRIFADFCIGK